MNREKNPLIKSSVFEVRLSKEAKNELNLYPNAVFK